MLAVLSGFGLKSGVLGLAFGVSGSGPEKQGARAGEGIMKPLHTKIPGLQKGLRGLRQASPNRLDPLRMPLS